MNLANKRLRASIPPQTVNKNTWPVVFKDNIEALWGRADRTKSLNSHLDKRTKQVQTNGSICTLPKRFTVAFEINTATYFVYT